MFNLYDNLGSPINPEDIVKYENLLTDTVNYYLCGNSMLYKYDNNGQIENSSFRNIKIDNGITLVNDSNHRWTRMGTEAEVYDEIFYN